MAAQVINYIINKAQGLGERVTHTQAATFRKIDHFGIQAVAHGTPFVLLKVVACKNWNVYIVFMAPCQFRNQGLREGDEGKSILNGGRHIADTELQRIKKWVWADIPPDFLPVIDTSRLNQVLHILVELIVR